MRRNSIISVTLFLIAFFLMLSLFSFKTLIFRIAQGQIFADTMVKFISSPMTTSQNLLAILQLPAIDLGPTFNAIIGAVIPTIGVVIAAIIGFKGKKRANEIRKIRKEREKEKERAFAKVNNRFKTNRECADYYRQRLLNDHLITTVQVLTMNRPLQVTKMVQLRLSRQEVTIETMKPKMYSERLNLTSGQKQLSDNRVRMAMGPEKAVSECKKRCVIVGDPGAGKTTLLKYFAVKSGSGELPGFPDLPIYIELNKFASSGASNLLDYASSSWQERYDIPKKDAFDCIKENLENQNILWLLDALNETAIGDDFGVADLSYKRTISAIERIGGEIPIIVTTRKADYLQRPLQNAFTKLEVLDFSPEDIREFINRWFADHPDQYKRKSSADLNSKIERNPPIQNLASNPLMLVEIAIVYEECMDLPQDRANLYESCVDILLNKWHAEPFAQRPRQFKKENMMNLLEEIAWHFHRVGQRYFLVGELLEVIAKFLPAINLESEQNVQVLNDIASESGLLKEYAKGSYGFLHETIQEFFVARHIHEQEDIETLLMHCDESWWEEVLFLHAVYSKDAGLLLEKLLERGNKSGLQNDIFYTNLLLAGRCVATHPTIRKKEVFEKIITELFNVLLNTKYFLSRQQTIEILAEIGGREVNNKILAVLSDEHTPTNIQIAIVEALGRVGDSSLAKNLVQTLNENIANHNDVNKYIVSALGNMGERSTARSLLLYLQNQQPAISDEVGKAITDALCKLGVSGKLDEGDSITSELFQLLSRNQINQDIRGRIAITLGKFGDPSLAAGLVNLLSDQRINLFVRTRIVEALGILGDLSVVDNLERILSKSKVDLSLRISIVDTLGVLGEHSDIHRNKIIQRLQGLFLRQDEDPDIRGHAAIALGKIGDQSIADTILKQLLRPGNDVFLSQKIVTALGQFIKRFPDPDLIQKISTELLTILANSKIDSGIRICIAQFMGTMGDRIQTSHTSDLLKILNNSIDDLQVSEAIIDALSRLNEQTVATNLYYLLSYPNVELTLQGHIVYVLCLLRYEKVLSTALKFLSEENLKLQIRCLIADSLGALSEKIPLSDMIQLLANTTIDSIVRHHIAETLVKIDVDETSVLELATLLQDSDIVDDIHRTLWEVSRRIGVRIVMHGQGPQILRWRDEFDR